MKATILLILAMCFAFAMPAQADEGYEGFAPVESLIVSGDVIGPKVTDDKVTTCRCMRSQLESAEFYLQSQTVHALIGGVSSNALLPDGSGAMHEVGWRSSPTAT